jgi:hypothetical protein
MIIKTAGHNRQFILVKLAHVQSLIEIPTPGKARADPNIIDALTAVSRRFYWVRTRPGT